MEKSAAARALRELQAVVTGIDEALSNRGLPTLGKLDEFHGELFEAYRKASDELIKLAEWKTKNEIMYAKS